MPRRVAVLLVVAAGLAPTSARAEWAALPALAHPAVDPVIARPATLAPEGAPNGRVLRRPAVNDPCDTVIGFDPTRAANQPAIARWTREEPITCRHAGGLHPWHFPARGDARHRERIAQRLVMCLSGEGPRMPRGTAQPTMDPLARAIARGVLERLGQ